MIRSEGAPDVRFEGTAHWQPDRENMAYREEGSLLMPGQMAIFAERSYVWTPELAVYFDDGRFFHNVPATGGDTDHWCDPDTYKGSYDFAKWPEFSVTWRVSGPRKDYTSVTIYHRL